MIDSELIKGIIDQLKTQQSLLWAVIIFCGANILASIGNTIVQFKLKRYETKVHSRNIQAQERVNVMKQLFEYIDQMRDINHDPNLLLHALNQAFAYLNKNAIQLNKDEEKLVRNRFKISITFSPEKFCS